MTASRAPRVVYDCNIYVQALISVRGPAARCVVKAAADEVTLFVTPLILDEIRESWQKIPAKYAVTRAQTEELAARVSGVSVILQQVPHVFDYERDPDDAHYIDVAVAADAKLIVSRDKDLLDLMDAARPESRAFRSRFPSLRIIDPVELLRELDAAARSAEPS
jgi:putative PIN family toxin of toxin-antitoxin system